MLNSAVIKDKSETITLKEAFMGYNGYGGAYLFLPNSQASGVETGEPTVIVVKGKLVEEVTTIFSVGPIKKRVARLFQAKGLQFVHSSYRSR